MPPPKRLDRALARLEASVRSPNGPYARVTPRSRPTPSAAVRTRPLRCRPRQDQPAPNGSMTHLPGRPTARRCHGHRQPGAARCLRSMLKSTASAIAWPARDGPAAPARPRRSFQPPGEALKGAFGEIGDNRLVVMAIAVLDELAGGRASHRPSTATSLNSPPPAANSRSEAEELEQRFARCIAEAARKVESIATAIGETGSPPANLANFCRARYSGAREPPMAA